MLTNFLWIILFDPKDDQTRLFLLLIYRYVLYKNTRAPATIVPERPPPKNPSENFFHPSELCNPDFESEASNVTAPYKESAIVNININVNVANTPQVNEVRENTLERKGPYV